MTMPCRYCECEHAESGELGLAECRDRLAAQLEARSRMNQLRMPKSVVWVLLNCDGQWMATYDTEDTAIYELLRLEAALSTVKLARLPLQIACYERRWPGEERST